MPTSTSLMLGLTLAATIAPGSAMAAGAAPAIAPSATACVVVGSVPPPAPVDTNDFEVMVFPSYPWDICGTRACLCEGVVEDRMALLADYYPLELDVTCEPDDVE